jgi:hypothetical protein
VDEALEVGSALLQAGSLFHYTQWSKDGKTILTFVEQHAFLSHYHVFASYMDNVLLQNGKLNPTETFFHGTDPGGQITVVLAALALLRHLCDPACGLPLTRRRRICPLFSSNALLRHHCDIGSSR